MPVYNEEKFLAESIGSILNQTYYNFELLILDDASTDNSFKIIKAYAKEDKRIKVLVNKTNKKQAKCRNRLLKNTKTEFIAWMDADDISLEDRLQTQMDFLKQNSNIDAVGIQYSAFGSSVNLPAGLISHYSLSDLEIKTNFIFGYDFLFGGSLMRMKKIKQHNIFFDNNYKLSTGEDHQYIIDCFSFMKFANLDKVLYQYRQDSNQTTAINQKQILNNASVIIREHLLKFNIKTDLETTKIFLKWNDDVVSPQTSQKFQEAVRVFEEIFTIKDFYGYSDIKKSPLIAYFLNLLSYLRYSSLLKKNRKIFKNFFEALSRQCSVADSTMFLKKIYYRYCNTGLEGESFFIKDFGFLDGFKPILTVLMPVYNEENFLVESIGSILDQNYYNFELLILDDGSTDNSLKIIKDYAKEDKRIKILVNKTNQGEVKCRNRLLKNTKTEFIAWMDADDISLEDRLQHQMDFLKQNSNIDAVGTQYSALGSNVNLPADFTSHYSLSDLEIKTGFILGYDFLFPSSLMRMKKIKQHNIFFDNNCKISTGADHQYILDCFSFMKFGNLDKVLYQYRQDSNQTTAINQKQILNNTSVIIRKHLLKLNIKTDLETVKIFLKCNDDEVSSHTSQKFLEIVKVFDKIFFIKRKFDIQKFQKVLKVLCQLTAIKNFYNYARTEKSFFIPYCLALVMYFYQIPSYKKDRETISELFRDILKQYPDAESRMFLKKIYSHCRDGGLGGKLFFIKDFGIKNYFKIKTW